MSLAVLTPAAVTDLIELASVKSRLGISDSSEDTLLAEYIDEACAMVREGLGRELARQRYTETFWPRVTSTDLVLGCNPIDPDSVTITIEDEALAADDFEIRDASAGLLWRQSGWPAGDEIAVTYIGGFLISGSATAKGVITTWAVSQAYAVGAWVRTAALTPLRLECTTAGTSGSSEPTVPAAGSTVTDGTAVWTARQAEELPVTLRQLLSVGVRDLRDIASRPAGLLSSEGDGFSESYSVTGSPSAGPSPEWLSRLILWGQRYRRN